jgi:hypothetical protein
MSPFATPSVQQIIHSLSHYPTDLVRDIQRGAGHTPFLSGRQSDNVVDFRGRGPDDQAPYTEDGAWAAITNPYPISVANSMGLTEPYLHQAGKPGAPRTGIGNALNQWLLRALRGED